MKNQNRADAVDSAQYDVVVVGSGISGLSAALTAAQGGLRVLLAEKEPWFGGTTALSSGCPWIIANDKMTQPDSPEAGRTYIRAVVGNYYDEEKVGAFVETGAEALAFLEKHSDVGFSPIPMPDYYPEATESRVGRTIFPKPYDGRKIGPYFRHLRPSLRAYAPLGGLQIDPGEGLRLSNMLKNVPDFLFGLGRIGTYFIDRLRYGRDPRLRNGQALVASVMKGVIDAGVELWREAPATGLLLEEGAVRGVTIRRAGRDVTVRARRGVVLASGGFGASRQLRNEFIPNPDLHLSASPKGNTGDGLTMGRAIGARVSPQASNSAQGFWTPVSRIVNRNGSVEYFPHFGFDRAKPGCIMVDEQGRRFVNEATNYQALIDTMHRKGVKIAWLLGDRRMLRKYGMGFAFPAPHPYRHLIRNGYLIEGRTVADLARKIGVDPTTLETTIARSNACFAEGLDPDFRRGESPFDHTNGDYTHRPNPCLGPMDRAPFYAIEIHAGDVGSVAGLETDGNAQVKAEDGSLIPGLYAVGLDMQSFARGSYPGGGSSIGPGLTFGYRAARHILASA